VRAEYLLRDTNNPVSAAASPSVELEGALGKGASAIRKDPTPLLKQPSVE